MNSEPHEIEHSFRKSWRGFNPLRIPKFLDKVPEENRLELLSRLLRVELSYAFDPPPTEHRKKAEEKDDGDTDRVKPCMQLFVHIFPELKSDQNLMVGLIVLEYALRLQSDEKPTSVDTYVAICSAPHLISRLEDAARCLGRQAEQAGPAPNHFDSTVKDGSVSQSISIGSPPLNVGYFLLTRLVGKGGMGLVHAAIDLRSTAQVAVKVMRRIDSWSISRFIEEFRWLSQLEHPNLVKLYNAHREGDLRFFSMELVEGRTIRDWFFRLSSDSDTRWTRLRKVLGQIASAIQYMHDNQVIHCDIKSSNMMITRKRRAVLLDLGLAVREGQTNPFVGTFEYMAPEVLADECPTRASDWFSFGVMVHEVITNNFPPVEVTELGEKNQRSYTLNTEKLDHNLKDLPVDLAQLCKSLLAIDPNERPLGASVVTQLGGQIRLTTTHDDCGGRQSEIAKLNRRLHQVKLGRNSYAVILGESGIGKSTLVRHWITSNHKPEYLVLFLKCYHQDLTPNRVLNSLLQELAIHLQDDDHESWKPSLRKYIDRISVVFPQVQQLDENFDIPQSGSQEHAASRDECNQALVSWLVEISKQRPLIIVVDDVQWSDEGSCQVLASMLQQEEFCGMITLVGDKSDDRSTSWLKIFPSAPDEEHNIDLAPLSKDECISLLKKWALESTVIMEKRDAENLADSSGGNPFLLRELSRSHLANHSLGNVDPAQLDKDNRSRVKHRFSNLPQGGEKVLQVLAVANQTLSLHQLQMITRIKPQDLQRALSLLTAKGWIRSRYDNPESEIEIAHEKYRHAILQRIPKDRLHRRHYRIAGVLSAESPPPWSRIAEHYRMAEHPKKAAACYLEAARSAASAYAHQEALMFIDKACTPDANRTHFEQRRVELLRAECLSAVGSSRASAESYEKLIGSTDDPKELRLLECLAGEQWIRAGQPEPGLVLLRRALSHLGTSSSSAGRFAAYSLRFRTLIAAFARHKCVLSRRRKVRIFSDIERCLNRVASPLTFLDNQLGPELILQLEKLSCSIGDQSDRAHARIRMAILLSFAGKRWRKIAAHRMRVGRQLAAQSGHELSRAIGHLCMFVWHTQRGTLHKAERSAGVALELFERCGETTQWDQQFIKWGVLGCHWNSLQLRKLKTAVADLRDSAIKRDDPMSVFWLHVTAAHWSDLVSDQTDAARASLKIAENAIASDTFQAPRFFVWLTKIHLHLYESDHESAQRLLWEDWRELSRSMVLSTNHMSWLALHTRICCDLLSAVKEPAKKKYWARDAQRCAKKMLKLEERPFIAYGRVLGLVADAAAEKQRPLAEWDAAIAELETLNRHLLANAARWHRSLYSPPEEADTFRQIAKSSFENEGCIQPERLLNMILPLPTQRSNGKV